MTCSQQHLLDKVVAKRWWKIVYIVKGNRTNLKRKPTQTAVNWTLLYLEVVPALANSISYFKISKSP